MTQPIQIHPMDTPERARDRHAEIEKRLEELGADNVRSMIGHGLPTNWDPIIHAWLAGDKLEPEKDSGDDQGRAEV